MLVTDKLLSGDDNNDTGDTCYTLISKHLILAAIEFVNNSAKGMSTLAFLFQCKCVSACFFLVLGVHLGVNSLSSTLTCVSESNFQVASYLCIPICAVTLVVLSECVNEVAGCLLKSLDAEKQTKISAVI